METAVTLYSEHSSAKKASPSSSAGSAVVKDTKKELYNKALLFFENTSGNMTALLNTGNICVNISSNYTLENRSILSPIRFSGVAAKYSSTLIYDLIPGTRSSAPFTLAAEFSSDLTVTMLICGDSCSSTLCSFYLLYTNTSHEFFTASPWHLIDDIDKRISS